MWKKCIILEHCVHIALIRFQGCHILSIQKNLAGIWLFQACNDPQCGGFSTAGRPQQSDKFSFFCCKTDAFQDVLTFLEALFYIFSALMNFRTFSSPSLCYDIRTLQGAFLI